ncbi:MAG: bifunctional demethylmenaquinone methyltransferase/2-methoxy-6-polyprenyl-1,4-benzoquinol methylase UbiE [Planctomycetes bacterium]|nr:bifunctional demethylmenaquinone methyltransferase/2-methoxy-6-polyprenyl-1,4-benzoquinol methylase UbiE [Planctomycetota bacterium]
MPESLTIRRMFARVARRYDRANHLLSLGVDRLWRRQAVRFAALQPGEDVLDVCSGTGDLAFAFARAGGRVTGADFCGEMLVHAVRKAAGRAGAPRFLAADTLALPFDDEQFDLVTVAFGIRNVADPRAGLREMARVLRPGGRALVLEFCRPRAPLVRRLYLFYFRRILPRLGSWISGDREGAYHYLQDSVMRFPERDEFLAMMTDAGLVAPRLKILSGGIAALYLAEKPRVASAGARIAVG